MLRYNSGDFGMSAIMAPLKRAYDGKEIKTYYVYGVADEVHKPHLRIRASKLDELDLAPLKAFFEGLGMAVQIAGPRDGLAGNPGVSIGLRRDVRRNADLAKSVVRIIIHYAEGKLTGGLQPVVKKVELGPYEPQSAPEAVEAARCEECDRAEDNCECE